MRLVSFFKRLLPPLSETEKIALRCGGLSIDRQLFENKVLAGLPSYRLFLKSEEQDFLRNETEVLCGLRTSTQEAVTPSQMNYLREQGFFGLCLPKGFGGKGFSSYAHSRIVQKIASHCPSLAVTVMVPNSLGPGELLVKYGTLEQQKTYLPNLARGKQIPCFGLTGPENGSDALGRLDRGRLLNDQIEFECNKRWITLAPIADLIGLAIDIEDIGVTVLLLERTFLETHGVVFERHFPVGGHFWNGTIRTTRPVKIPVSCVLGGPSKLGKGWEMLMECLAEGRGISLPALSTGIGATLCIKTSYYAKARVQFRRSIGDMQGVQWKIGHMIANTYSSLAMHELFNATLLKGEHSSVLSAILKYKTTEMARETITHAMDIFAGKGITTGSRNPLVHFFTQVPIAITVEGSNTLTRSLIIFAQGINKSHPHVAELVLAMEENDEESFRDGLFKMIQYCLRHTQKSFSLNYSSHDITNILEHRTSLFLLMASVALFKGKQLKTKQIQTGRLADVFTDLYTCYSLLWYQKFPHIEKLLVRHLLSRIDTTMMEICNQENILWKMGLRPWRPCPSLRDEDWIELSQVILTNKELDQYLETFVYLDPRDPIIKMRACLLRGETPCANLLRDIIQVDAYSL